MHLIIISHTGEVKHEASLINALFNAGLTCFHLRKPSYNEAQIKMLLRDIDPQFYGRIALHQHHYLAAEYGTIRLHYTEKARQQTSIDDLLKKRDDGYILSTSVHETKTVYKLNHFNYTFFSPVFDSISKPGYYTKIKPDFRLPKSADWPAVIALGGITVNQLATVEKMGFDGAAVLGAIWNKSDEALQVFKVLQDTLQQITTKND